MKPLSQEQFEVIKQWMADDKSVDAIVLMNFIDRFQPQPEQPTLIPFNLEEALANHDRVVYRDGSKPLEWHFYSKIDNPWSIISVLQNQIMVHRNDGTYHEAIGRESKYDLCLLPEAKKEPKELYMNVYDDSLFYESFDVCKKAINDNRKYLKTISFTI